MSDEQQDKRAALRGQIFTDLVAQYDKMFPDGPKLTAGELYCLDMMSGALEAQDGQERAHKRIDALQQVCAILLARAENGDQQPAKEKQPWEK